MSTFSEILKRERENKGYSKAELARKLNIPYTTYQNYENGREPKIEVIKDISKALNIDPSVFIWTKFSSNWSLRNRVHHALWFWKIWVYERHIR